LASLGDDFENCGYSFTDFILLCLHALIPLRLSLEMNPGDPVSKFMAKYSKPSLPQVV
jgi:hypothetical protein